MIQKLIFNTTNKTVEFYDDNENVIKFDFISTVKCEPGYYEVIQVDINGKKYPIFRAPILNTNMFIEK